MHQLQPQRPEELWMMVREVSLGRFKQLLLRIAGELRPTLAVRDPSVTVLASGHSAAVLVTLLNLRLRPAEYVCVCDPGPHGRDNAEGTLSIRFQIVAGRRTR
jgi:hypothetical protein